MKNELKLFSLYLPEGNKSKKVVKLIGDIKDALLPWHRRQHIPLLTRFEKGERKAKTLFIATIEEAVADLVEGFQKKKRSLPLNKVGDDPFYSYRLMMIATGYSVEKMFGLASAHLTEKKIAFHYGRETPFLHFQATQKQSLAFTEFMEGKFEPYFLQGDIKGRPNMCDRNGRYQPGALVIDDEGALLLTEASGENGRDTLNARSKCLPKFIR
jgi:hypothetical protein